MTAKVENGLIIHRQGAQDTIYGDRLNIEWLITNACNYDCSYCFDQGDKRPAPGNSPVWDDLKKAADRLIALNRSYYYFHFVGGEPTIHPDFSRLLQYLGSALSDRLSLTIFTNGSRGGDYFSRLLPPLMKKDGTPAVQIYFSIHPDRARLPDIIDLLEKTTPLAFVRGLLMFKLEQRQYVERIHEELARLRSEHLFDLSISQLLAPPNFTGLDCRYTERDLAWIGQCADRFSEAARNSDPSRSLLPRPPRTADFWDVRTPDGQRVIHEYPGGRADVPPPIARSEGWYSFKDLWCALGSHCLVITIGGDCYGAQCSAAREAKRGNIFRSDPYQDGSFPKLIQCPLDFCPCAINQAIPKFSDGREARAFLEARRSRRTE